MFPCQHITRIYIDITDRKYHSKSTIHSYWHVKNHPLYKTSKETIKSSTTISCLGSIETVCDKVSVNTKVPQNGKMKNKETENNNINNTMSTVIFPKKTSIRYSTLHGLCEQFIDNVKENSSLYKLTKI